MVISFINIGLFRWPALNEFHEAGWGVLWSWSGASRLHQAGWLTLRFCSAPPGADGGSRAGLGGVPGAEFIPGVSGCDLHGRRETGTGRCLGRRQKCQRSGGSFGTCVLLPMGDIYNGCPGHSVWAPKLLGTEQGGPVGAAPPWRDELCSRSSGSKQIVDNRLLSIPFMWSGKFRCLTCFFAWD